jgi:hypothetical protein
MSSNEQGQVGIWTRKFIVFSRIARDTR